MASIVISIFGDFNLIISSYLDRIMDDLYVLSTTEVSMTLPHRGTSMVMYLYFLFMFSDASSVKRTLVLICTTWRS